MGIVQGRLLKRSTKHNRSSASRTDTRPNAPPATGQLAFRDGWVRIGTPVVLLTASVIMLCWTWRTWPDPFVDNGQQVYIPWRLAAGQALYRDIAFYNGPFSQHFNSLMFRLGGTSLNTYFAANLVVLGLFLVVANYALRQVASRLATGIACLAFILLFAFGQFDTVAGYNWVAPYAAEGTHGLLLGLTALIAMWHFPTGGRRWIAVSGLLVGISLLTKAEFALGAVGAASLALLLTLYTLKATLGVAARSVAVFFIACTMPAVLAVGLLSLQMPVADAINGCLGTWKLIFSSDVNTLMFHRLNMGTLDPWLQLSKIGIASAWYAAVLVPASLLGMSLPRTGLASRIILAVVFCGVGAVAFFFAPPIAWLSIGLPFSAAMGLLAILFFVLWIAHPRDESASLLRIRQLTLPVFALGMLAKILLNSRIHHYGFLHAAPAAMVMVVALWDWLPGVIHRYGGNGNAVRCAVLPLLMVCCAFYLTLQSSALKRFTVLVADGADSFYSDDRGRHLNSALEMLAGEMTPHETLAGLPASCMLNYLARRPTTIPFTQITPTEVGAYGEQTILTSLEQQPPDWIALAHFDAIEFGQRFFGQHFAQAIAAWMITHYEPRAQMGAVPFEGDEFGVIILKRVPPATVHTSQ